MITITQTKAEDFSKIKPVENIRGCALPDLSVGETESYWVGGEIIAIVGVVPFMPGVGSAWAVVAKVYAKHRKEVSEVIKDFVWRQAVKQKLHRVQTPVLNTPQFIRWSEEQGFHKESIMRHFSPNAEHMAMMVYFPALDKRRQ